MIKYVYIFYIFLKNLNTFQVLKRSANFKEVNILKGVSGSSSVTLVFVKMEMLFAPE